jgi:hypothetical protein
MSQSRPQIVSIQSGGGVVPVNAAETAILTSPPISTSGPSSIVRVKGVINWVTGGSTTSVVVRLRRGTDATGTALAVASQVTVGAALAVNVALNCTDTPGEVAGQQYTLTAQQTAGAGNGSQVNVSLEVTAE